jgi:hypothetical protein
LPLLLLGCQATFRDPRVPAGVTHERWQSFYLFGAFGAADVDVRDVCGGRPAREIRTRSSWLALLLSFSVVYTPRIVTVTCAR